MPHDREDPESQAAPAKFTEKDAGDGTNRFDQQAHGMGLVLSVLSCSISMFLIALDQTIIFTMLETVGNKWGEYDKVSWIASGYMLTMAMFAQIWGKCSIYFGRKQSLLLAICIFELGSLVAAVSPTMDALIVGRVISGIGGGGIQTLVFIVISELVPISKRSLMFALMGVIFSISSVVGPLVGGAFTDSVSWRWCFYINLPLGGFAFVCLVFFFHPPQPQFTWKEKFSQVDYLGCFLMVSGIVLLLVALTVGGTQLAWNSAGVICLFIFGSLVSIGFCVWNFKYADKGKQMVPTAVVQVFVIDIACIHLFLLFFTFMGFSIFITSYFQVVRGYDAIKSGLHFLPMVLSLVISSICTGILIRKTTYIKPFAVLSGLTGVIGYGITSLMHRDGGMNEMIGYLILPGISIGIGMQSGIMSSQLSAPKIAGGMIMTTTFNNFSRALGGALGSTLCQVIYNAILHNTVRSEFIAHPAAFPGITVADLEALANSPKSIQQLSTEGADIILDSVMHSIRSVLYFCTGIGGLAFIVTIFYSNKKLPTDQEVEKKSDYEEEEKENLEENLAVEQAAIAEEESEQDKGEALNSVDSSAESSAENTVSH